METLNRYPRCTSYVPSAQLFSVRSLQASGANVGVLGSMENSSLCRELWVICISVPHSLCRSHDCSFPPRNCVFLLVEMSANNSYE